MKKNKLVRIGIFVLVVMFILSGAVLAADGMKNIQVHYKNIKVFVNNVLKTPSQEPFLLNGTTYVPLRFISEALGADVDWNGATSTISINLDTTDAAEVETLRN